MRVMLLTVVLIMLITVASEQRPRTGDKKRLKLLPESSSCFKLFRFSRARSKTQMPVVGRRDLIKMRIRRRCLWCKNERVVHGIFHWAYALAEDLIFHVVPLTSNATSAVPEIRFLDEYDYPDLWSKGPNPRDEPLLGDRSVSLAHRLNGVEVYYNSLRCNCRHYIDYVVYGTTFGWKWNPNVNEWPIDNYCPLHRRLTSDMDFEDDNFMLEDGFGNSYPINPIPD